MKTFDYVELKETYVYVVEVKKVFKVMYKSKSSGFTRYSKGYATYEQAKKHFDTITRETM